MLSGFRTDPRKRHLLNNKNNASSKRQIVLRPINPDIILLQEVRDYDVCTRLGEAIAPGTYHVAICSAFKEPFQKGLDKQQVAILSKYQAQAAIQNPGVRAYYRHWARDWRHN